MEIATTNKVRRIAITGPESTGKSHLAEALAQYFGCLWVPEYAREYLDLHPGNYLLQDIVAIAKGQLRMEKEYFSRSRDWLFCDTELIVTKIWAEHVFHYCPEWIEEQISLHPYELYLLCDVDLPWEADPLREHPQLRKYFFDLFEKELISRGFPYGIVRGEKEMRLENAIKLIHERFTNSVNSI